MIDGHAIKEKSLSEIMRNKDSRVDSQFWTTEIVKNDNYSYDKIGNLIKGSQYGISVDMNTDGKGYPIFRMNELHDMLMDLSTEKYADITPVEYQNFSLNDGDVLFNRTNSYEWVGRTAVYYKNNETPFTYASYLVKFVPDTDRLLPEYLATYLSSKNGVLAIKSRARQSVNQTNVNPEEVKEIEIPLLSMSFQKILKSCFVKANSSRIQADDLYKEATDMLAESMNINIPVNSSINVKSFSNSFLQSGRFDAEYYQPKYETIVQCLNTNENVDSICIFYNDNYLPDNEELYQYIELANVGESGDISNVEITRGKELPTRARRLVKKGQVIVSSVEGSLSSCALITDEYDGALCSTGFYVVRSEKINSETLLVLFKSKPIQELLKQRCSGTILTAISKDEFLAMPLPLIDETIQNSVAEKVQESFALRRESKRLLDMTVKAVEMAIETSEDTALLWLELQ